ncbi:MAG TPA: hypothetical protein VGF75_06465 [Candidatus Saccharimonadales bacterium]
MSSKNNHSELARLLQKAKESIETGENTSKRSTTELTNVKLDEHTIIGKDGVPIKETDQSPDDKTVIAE